MDRYKLESIITLLIVYECLYSGFILDTDHTCYTMTTAGKDGFLELFPIYLDHILFPTLTVSLTNGFYNILLMT